MELKKVALYCRVAIDNDEVALAERKKKEAVKLATSRILADINDHTVGGDKTHFCAGPLCQCRILQRFERMAYNRFLVALLIKNLADLSHGMPMVIR